MISIAHLVHPVVVDTSSDLVTAQPITFKAMSTARRFAMHRAEVTLLAVQYNDEKQLPLPGEFRRLPDLDRSVTNIKSFAKKRKLALIKDPLDRLYRGSEAEYLIYSNVDITPLPYFYTCVETAAGTAHFIYLCFREPGTTVASILKECAGRDYLQSLSLMPTAPTGSGSTCTGISC